jgi:hypothetical protein
MQIVLASNKSWDANKNKTAETIIGVMSGYGFSAAYDAEDQVLTIAHYFILSLPNTISAISNGSPKD